MEIKYFISGCVAGSVQSIIGHPLDTLKTFSQNKIISSSFSIKSLYSGFTPSLIQSSFLTGTAFYINNYLYDLTQNKVQSSLYTGLLSCLIICPLEDLKIKRQMSHPITRFSMSQFNSSYKYLHLVSLREIPAITVYFSSYRYLKEQQINVGLAGGISGVLSWLITYPIDTIKSRMQSNLCSTIKESFQIGHLYHGLGYCLLRAFIVNGASFYTYEMTLSKIQSKF